MINAIMQSPEWKHTAIFLTWTTSAGSTITSAAAPDVSATGRGAADRGQPLRRRGAVFHDTSDFTSVLRVHGG